jgi:diacylglycerol kinase (ATP)
VGRFTDAWRNEGAFRQCVVLAAVLIPIACFLPARALERALLIAAALLVIVGSW